VIDEFAWEEKGHHWHPQNYDESIREWRWKSS